MAHRRIDLTPERAAARRLHAGLVVVVVLLLLLTGWVLTW